MRLTDFGDMYPCPRGHSKWSVWFNDAGIKEAPQPDIAAALLEQQRQYGARHEEEQGNGLEQDGTGLEEEQATNGDDDNSNDTVNGDDLRNNDNDVIPTGGNGSETHAMQRQVTHPSSE